MYVLNSMRWGTALAAGLIATVALLPQAKGQLVYENNSAEAADAQAEDRTEMRQVLGTSEKAQATQQAVESAPVAETEHLSKAELMRRARQREELKNEDILQERLEELRLRDERRRTDEVLGAGAASGPAVSTLQTAPMKEESVVAPITDHPGKPSLAPAMSNSPQSAPAPVGDTFQSSISLAPGEPGDSERTQISVSPRVGIANMVGDSTYLQVSPRFSAGLAAELGTGDYFTFQIGYLYSQYGVAMASNNPLVGMAQAQAANYGQGNFQSINMNQNVFDAGAKVHVLGVDSRVRPFVGAGGAYAISYLNFAPTLLGQLNSYYRTYAPGLAASSDYTVKNFLGYLSAGSDFRISKHISLGGEFRYYAVLSDQQSGNLGGLYGYYYGGINADPAIAGGALARNNFYTILGTLTFTF
jgi:hypothetical protein